MSLIGTLAFKAFNDPGKLESVATFFKWISYVFIGIGLTLTTYWLFAEDGTASFFLSAFTADDNELRVQTAKNVAGAYLPVLGIGALAGGVELAARRRLMNLQGKS